MDKVEYINYDTVREYVNIKDSDLFSFYLREIYKDLSERFDSNKKQGISKIAFYDYLKIPIFIAEKVFNSLDNDGDGFLNLTEFSKGLAKIYDGTFEETATEIFKIYDFDKDSKITPGDVKVLLSYLPLKTDHIKKEYKYQMESLDEIDDIVNQTFGSNKHLRLHEYLKILENTKSDIYLQLLCFLYNKKPFIEENISNCKKSSKNLNSINSESPTKKPDKLSSNKLLRSPSKKSVFSPVDNLLTFSLEKQNVNEMISGLQGMMRMPNTKTIDGTDYGFNSPTKILKQKNSGNSLSKKSTDKIEFEGFSLENNLISMFPVDDDEDAEDNSEIVQEVPKQKSDFEDWIYKLGDNNTKLKKYWLVLIGKDIFYYNNEEKTKLEGMHNLSSCFIKENKESIVLGQKVFSFSIAFQPKSRTYYLLDKDSFKKWVSILSKAIGYLNFFDFYEMMDEIGVGKFGLVKLGVHKNTKKRVAIKIMKKEDMNNSDIELVKGELDIMMMCAHPNIVKLLDHFENMDFIFIVMEHLSGGDLGTFLEKRKCKVSEALMSNIMFQMANALEYLHRYGIVHRDLKPENIMLQSVSENPIIKIMDFGLSKIMGPSEKAADGYGTLTYVAPEVLVRQPYNKQIDIWSLGVMIFYGLTGTLPFDDPSDNEEKIAKMIVFQPVEFKKSLWAGKSEEVIDIIKACLTKKPEERLDTKKFLQHPWIKKYNKE